jgi:hypothetical protein
MESVLTSPIVRTATSSGSVTWLDVLVRWVRRTTLSASERELLDLARRAAERVGAPLLGATSLDELEARLEAAALDPELQQFGLAAWRRVTLESLAAATWGADPDPDFVRVLGPTPARIVAAANPMLGAVISVMVQLLVTPGPDTLDGATDLQSFLVEPGIPSEIKLAVLRGTMSSAALLGLSHAVLTEAKLDPWLALALAEHYRDGLRSYLGFLAGLPVHVPESVLPLAERLDIEALQQRVEMAEAEIAQLVDQAAAAPDGVFWSGDPDDDP